MPREGKKPSDKPTSEHKSKSTGETWPEGFKTVRYMARALPQPVCALFDSDIFKCDGASSHRTVAGIIKQKALAVQTLALDQAARVEEPEKMCLDTC